jgi:hypothetical protein
MKVNDEDLARAVEQINSSEPQAHLHGISFVRRLLSECDEESCAALVTKVIATGILPRLVSFLSSDATRMQIAAAWVLTNVAAGDSAAVRAVVDAGALPPLVALLHSPLNGAVRVQAVWAIGNIVGDGKEMRDLVLASFEGVVAAVLANFEDMSRKDLVHNSTWTLANICNHQPPLWVVRAVLPTLLRCLPSADLKVTTEASWTLARICSSNDDDRIQAVIDAGAVPAIVSRLSRERKLHTSQRAVVHAISNIVTNASLSQFGRLPHCKIVCGLLDVLQKSGSIRKLVLSTVECIVQRADTATLRLLRESATEQSLVDSCIAQCERTDSPMAAFETLCAAMYSLERFYMLEICIALQSLELPALVTVIVLEQTSEFAAMAPFHRKWSIATKVKHFKTAK